MKAYKLGIVALILVILGGCTGQSREVQFFNTTIKWTYQCLPVGQLFEVQGKWSSKDYLPIQRFTSKYLDGDVVTPHYLEMQLAVLSESQADLYVGKLTPLSNFGLVYLGRFKGGLKYSPSGPTIFGVWDFDTEYALIETYPEYTIPQARPIEICQYLAPARLKGKLG